MAENTTAYPAGSSSSLSPSVASRPEDESTVSNDASTAVGALILSLVFLLGVPGNLFVVWSILARTRRRSVTTLLILNLACADGFLMTLTIFFVVYLAKRSWVFGNSMCKLLFYLCNANMYASILLITLMSLYRLVAVVWPHRVSALAGWRTVLRALVAVWLLVMVMAVPALVFRAEKKNSAGHNESRIVCEAHHEKPQHAIFQYTFETVTGFVLPYGVIVSSYVCILRRLRQTRFRRRIRSEKLILAIVITFGLFWLPYHVINMMQVAADIFKYRKSLHDRLERIVANSRAVTSSLAFISSCVNPVLYTFVGKAYIRRNGLAFMARLFEQAGLDSGTRKSQHANQSKERMGLNSREREADSSTSNTANTQQNGR
ncbi:leukotriene B4 receptor 2b [Megalops cyprinoides]|uniref:leukotriene B4 receptor 2b n=1 Tax=Megalops cyprinoides TaxID=118141 RepID=UPI0018650EC8|nr:leukotriene B4 receptor 2b [Megalops cyprinoides]